MTNFFVSLADVHALAKLDPDAGEKLDTATLLEIGKRASAWLDEFYRLPTPKKGPTA